MDESGVHTKYSSIEDLDLDALVKAYKIQKPEAGSRYIRGHLRSVGIRVQKQRVLDSLERVDRVGWFIQRCAVICWRKYFSSRPNALWHCDGHHKLIKYGFVIHGFIDGNCRTVCIDFARVCLNLQLTHHFRSLLFEQTQTIMRAQFWNSFYLLWQYMAIHPVFVEIVEGKMFSFQHT